MSSEKGYWEKDGKTWHAPSLKRGHCTCGRVWDEGCAQVEHTVPVKGTGSKNRITQGIIDTMTEHTELGTSILQGAREALECAKTQGTTDTDCECSYNYTCYLHCNNNQSVGESALQGAKEALEYAKTQGTKDDSSKPEMRYFYFPGYLAIHYNDLSESAVELGARFHKDVLMSTVNTRDTSHLLEGLKDFEHSMFNENVHGSLSRKDVGMGISTVGKLGATKYGFLNYTKGFVWSRLLDAMARHVYEYMCGRRIDPESGLDHRYHVLANIYMLAEHIENETGVNDLIKEKE